MCIVLGILILALLAYIVYLYASYYRIEDNQELVVEAPVDDTTTGAAAVLATDTEYSAVTYNIGFGAYLPDYSFFMDGGTSSWAESPETVQYAAFCRNILPYLRRIMTLPSCSIRLPSPTAAAGQDSDCSRNIRCLPPCAEASPSPLPSASSSIWTAATASPGSRWITGKNW